MNSLGCFKVFLALLCAGLVINLIGLLATDNSRTIYVPNNDTSIVNITNGFESIYHYPCGCNCQCIRPSTAYKTWSIMMDVTIITLVITGMVLAFVAVLAIICGRWKYCKDARLTQYGVI